MKRRKKLTAKQVEASAESWIDMPEKELDHVNSVFDEAMAKEKKEAKFTARLSQNDFDGLKSIASDFGMGYQTLLGVIIHKYVAGKLVDVDEIRKLFPKIEPASNG
jgi:predicted DNA binding CopG/RHH family protein